MDYPSVYFTNIPDTKSTPLVVVDISYPIVYINHLSNVAARYSIIRHVDPYTN